jgi:hypothetical protein
MFVVGFSFLSHKVNTENGWLWRLEKDHIKIIEVIKNPKDFHKNNWGGADYKIGGWISKDINAEPDIFLMGDSHAGHLKYGLDHILVQKHNKHIYSPYLISSMRLPDFICTARGEKSKLRFESDLKFLQKNQNAVVVLSHSWVGQIKLNKVYNSTTQNYESLDADSTGWKVVAQKIEKFHSLLGKDRKIIVIGETPSLPKGEINYVETLLRPKYLKSITPKSMFTFQNNRMNFNSFFQTYFKSNKNITFINPASALCNDSICIKQLNQKIYFSDNNHLTREGSYKVIEYIKPQLLEILDN